MASSFYYRGGHNEMKIPKFLDILDAVLLEEAKNGKEKYKDSGYRHYPSSASFKCDDGRVVGACLRQLYYRATKEPESADIETTGLLQMGFGDAIHVWIQGKLAKSKDIRITSESKGKVLLDELTRDVSYRLDGLVTYDGEHGGLEIKTTQSRAVSDKEYGIKAKGPKEDHLLQVITYMGIDPALKWFSLVYFGRDSAYRLEFHITREGDKFFVDGKEIKDLNFTGVKNRWIELETFIKDVKVPPRDYKVWLKPDGTIQETKTIKGKFFKSDFRCLYCSYAEKCWSEPDAQNDAYKQA